MIDKKFGKVLKALRTERGFSQEEFAMNVGLHRTYISQLERGLKSPSLRTIKKI
ncbi:MAG TPA: XRE family transcriptional regulator [Desulfotomaculum sp.]|nr:XRE family transcriptional regulator [Desulfotomaculum sp.]